MTLEVTGQPPTTKVYCTSFESKIGRIYVASTEDGVCKISVPKESRKDFFDWLKRHFDIDSIIDNRSKNREVIDQLTTNETYFFRDRQVFYSKGQKFGG